MGSIRTCVTLVLLALTLGFATSATAQPLSGPEFIPLANPCRALDTRVTGTPLQANVSRTIQIGGVTTGGNNCGVPTTAVAAALYFAITQAQGPGHMAAWPSGDPPQTAAVNFVPGEDVGNAIDIGLGPGATVIVQSIVNTHLVVDVYGYFLDVEELGNGNTALGDGALASNITGTNNTAVGFQALQSNTTGVQNTATGRGALVNNTTGNVNTATGFGALENNTTGTDNTAIGAGALSLNTTGTDNTATGRIALFNNTTGIQNTATGRSALTRNTTGNVNTATGVNALALNTTGSNNTATGGSTLLNNTTGRDNTATGSRALENNTTGIVNTATGSFALFNNTTGTDNTATGSGALGSNTTGFNNTALGVHALASHTTGSFNTATGVNALFANTTGVQNTATGSLALQGNDTGNGNTAMGYEALGGFDTTGSNNTAIGNRAGANLTTGNNNIHIGNAGTAADTALIRIGTVGAQTATFIAGISGVPVSGALVVVSSNGQLGTAPSSRRAKDDIRDMDEASTGLGKLRPVTFRYKAEPPTGPRPIEYGLIAEEVAEIYPELVVLDKDGQPAGVRYHILPAMLLNELQRQQRVIEAQTRILDELTARLSRLEAKDAAAAGR